jgi:hypothetical protein
VMAAVQASWNEGAHSGVERTTVKAVVKVKVVAVVVEWMSFMMYAFSHTASGHQYGAYESPVRYGGGHVRSW